VEGVAISTVHGVKGLEFQAVILYYVTDGFSLTVVRDHSGERRRASSPLCGYDSCKEHLIFYVPYKQPGKWLRANGKALTFPSLHTKELWEGKPNEIESLYAPYSPQQKWSE